MNIIKQYELGYLSQKEFLSTITDYGSDWLEDEMGSKCISYYHKLAQGFVAAPFYVQQYGGDVDDYIERNCQQNKSIETDPSPFDTF